ncbi:hypothetical protein ACTQ5K_20120 [Niallia sp. Sow4_A1]|uniref:hypothetical protein n=1 Tax=Niallia sp. Sow4_A1 TaxID=3438793 RepID=UPI003F9C1703
MFPIQGYFQFCLAILRDKIAEYERKTPEQMNIGLSSYTRSKSLNYETNVP